MFSISGIKNKPNVSFRKVVPEKSSYSTRRHLILPWIHSIRSQIHLIFREKTESYLLQFQEKNV